MGNAPAARDWTRIYVAQRADAGKHFGDFEGNGPDGKAVPRMDAAHARELLKYWYAAGAEAEARAKVDGKTSATLGRLATARKRFQAAMEPFAASVLLDVPLIPTGQSVLLSREACIAFWKAVWGLASSLSAAGVAPAATDLWWSAVGEAAREAGKAVADAGKAVASAATSGISGGVLVLVVLGGLWLWSNRSRRG